MPATKTRTTRRSRVTKDIVPKGPCVGFQAVDSLIWRAQVASLPAPVHVDATAFEDALAALQADVADAKAEHMARAAEYDQQERAIRGRRPVHARPQPQEVPVAVVTVVAPEGKGAFYHLNAATGQLEAAPMDAKAEGHMAEILRLHQEQDGTHGESWGAPVDVPGPEANPPAAQPSLPRKKADAPGPGTPNDDPALD